MYAPCPMDKCDSDEERPDERPADASPADVPYASTSRRQYATLESLVALLPASPLPARDGKTAGAAAAARIPALCHLALRAALDLALRPYRDDPLLTLDGEFISVDAQIEALLAFVRAHGLLSGLLAELPETDRFLLPPDFVSGATGTLRGAEERGAHGEAPVVGAIWGSLYLPAAGAAVPCRVWAAYGPYPASARGEKGWRWPVPRPVRSVSADVAAAAQDALAAALAVLGRRSAALLRAPLAPGGLYYDVCCPYLGVEGESTAVAGRSLGLPLALTFLSALTGMAVSPFVGATGALDRESDVPDAVLPVEWIEAKAAAHRRLAAGSRFIVPPFGIDAAKGEENAVPPAADLTAAARIALRGFAAALDDAPARKDRAVPERTVAEAAPPVGERIAFLRTEIEGAVPLWEAQPAAMRRAVAEYETLFREAVSVHAGYSFGARAATGAVGALSAAFLTVTAASAAALELQQRLLLHQWPEPTGPLRMRGGIHRGGADLFEGDYYGPALAQLARLSDAANAGQILLSGAARRDLLLPDGADWRVTDLGSHRLRDLGEAMPLYQISRPGLPDAFDPPRSLENKRHNLPVQVTSFVGRGEEIAALRSLLLESGADTRLITLYGPGGVGKTRLALQVAAECCAAGTTGETGFDGGVHFISLADARTPEEAAAVMAQALRAPAATPTRTLMDQAIATLDGVPGRTLLLLDNLESILPQGAALVSQIVQGAPRCTVLITSRMLLNLRGERRVEVEPLMVPSAQAAQEDRTLAREAPALALFRARAREVSPGFDRPAAEGGTGETAVPLLCAICRRLDGLPLAIELAAARVRHLPLAEIERRLEDAFSLLVTRTQDTPERHRTLLATLHWSYDLLDDEERRFFTHLAVFAGGFTEAAVAAVTRCSDALDLLTALEEKSLVRCHVGTEGEPTDARYSLLNMVQDFARQRLAEVGGSAAAAAHAAYYADLVRASVPALDTPEEVAVFDVLDRDIDNLRAAHAHLCKVKPEAIPGLVADVAEFARRRGHWREWSEWPRHALELAANGASGEASGPDVLGRLYLQVATTKNDLGDADAAEREVHAALAHADRIAPHHPEQARRLRADALNLRGLVMIDQRRWSEATAALLAARADYGALQLTRGEAKVLNNLGRVALRTEDCPAARQYYGDAADLCRRTGDRRGLYHATNNLGLMSIDSGDAEAARELFRQAFTLARAQKDAILIGVAMLNLGDALEQCGDPQAALPLLIASEYVFQHLGHPHRDEARKYIDRCCDGAGQEILAATEHLRREYARKSMTALLTMEPSPEPMRLNLEPKTITLDGEKPSS